MERAQNLEAELIQQARRANIRTAYTKFQIFHKSFPKVHFAQPNDPRQEKPHVKSIKIMAVTNDPHQHRPTYDTHFSVSPSQSNFSLWMPIMRRESDCLLIMRRKRGLSKCQDAFLFIELCCQPSIPAVLPAPLRPPPTDSGGRLPEAPAILRVFTHQVFLVSIDCQISPCC